MINPLQKLLQKLISPNYKPDRLQGKDSQEGLPTSKELRYLTLQKIFTILVSEVNYENMTQSVVDLMVNEMDFLGGVLFLPNQEQDRLIAWTYTQSTLGKTVVSWLPKPFREYTYPLNLTSNLAVTSYLQKKIITTGDMSEVISPVVPKNLADTMQKFMGMKLCITLPIIYQNRTLGVLMLTSTRDIANDEEMAMLRTFADQVGIAINNSNLFRQIKDQVELLTAKNLELQSLYTLTANVSRTLDPKQVSQSSVDSLPQDQSMVGAVLGSYDAHRKQIKVIATSQNQLAYQVQKVIGDFGQYVINVDDPAMLNNTSVQVLKSGQPIFTNNLEEYLTPPVPKQFIPIIKSILNIKSLAVYPVISRGKIIGVIAFLMREKLAEELDANEKQLLTTYSNQIGIALDNANLYKMSQEIQESLETALTQLEESRKHERDMIDIMGHELRTPISIVRNALLMMDKQAKTNPQQPIATQAKLLDMAVESTRREVALIETLLSATKTDGKGFQLMMDRVNLSDVIQDSLNAFQKDAEKKGLTINYTPPSEPVYVFADKTRVQEVSDNFMSNAVKYTLKGSISIDISKDSEFGFISIKDSGIGITDSDLKRLGEKFFRARQYIDDQIAAHPELKEKIEVVRPGGTGLGLFVTFNLIKVMDGKLDIQSKVGQGSTFTFGLPLYNNQQAQQVEKKLEID